MTVYESLLDVPVDTYAGDDHDDADVPDGKVVHRPALRLLSVAAPSRPDPNQAVPFLYVKRNDRGPHVKALKRALWRAGYYPGVAKLFTAVMGSYAVKALNRFKAAHGLPANGVYDRATWQILASHFDAYSIRYLLDAKTPEPQLTAEQKLRNAFVAELMYLYNRRAAEAYTQARPWDQRKPPAGLDCSASGEWAAKWAGLKRAVFGWVGVGYGNTYSQLNRFLAIGGVRGGIAAAEPGDPFYYGRGKPTHVAYWLGDGRVWSFGAYPIKILPHDYRHDRIAICNLAAGQ